MQCRAVDDDEIETVECFRCGEVVAMIESEDSVCNWCLEADHQRQERYR